jgi:hypothetical protein
MNTALPQFSDEAIVRDRISLLETSTSFIAALSGIPQSRLSLAFSGTRALSAEDGHLLKVLTARLWDLKEALEPIPLALNNADRVRRLLAAIDRHDLTTEQIKASMSLLFGGSHRE